MPLMWAWRGDNTICWFHYQIESVSTSAEVSTHWGRQFVWWIFTCTSSSVCIRANALWHSIAFMSEMSSHKDSVKFIFFPALCLLHHITPGQIARVTPTQEVCWGVYVFQHRSTFPLRDIPCTWVSRHTFRFPFSLSSSHDTYVHACLLCVRRCEEMERLKKKNGGQLLSWCRTVVSTPSSCLANLPWVSLACCQAADWHTHAHTHKRTVHAAALCQGWCILSLHGSLSSVFFSPSMTISSAWIKLSFQAQVSLTYCSLSLLSVWQLTLCRRNIHMTDNTQSQSRASG